ncbi:hypothetical protein DH2020_044207 [Rehmannia glutinosa]|uniref:Uncharacterized protein n=1 Tax=Rehmannia glutinosa TaxID=99300 RepID=A0ABR0UHJ7_REHGL
MRKQRNMVEWLRDGVGNRVDDPEQIVEILRGYFQNLFNATTNLRMDRALEAIDTKITSDLNDNLCAPFTEIEVTKTLAQMHTSKAPVPMIVNFEKSELSFSGGINQEKGEDLATTIVLRRVDKQTIYLGLPASVGRSKKEIFQALIDHVTKKLKTWKARTL